MIAKDVNINNFYWGLNNKFKLEIGVRNFINSEYPEIIWFPQGMYVINSFNTQQGVNNYTISISGKDKMCLLNGDVSGNLPVSVDFGTIETTGADGSIILEKLPIKVILRELLCTYAREPYHNIILNDIEDLGLELLEYRGDTPMYLFYEVGKETYTQIVVDDTIEVFDAKHPEIRYHINNIPQYNARVDLSAEIAQQATQVKVEGQDTIYTVSKLEYGQTAGYKITDLTYPGELVTGIGDAITSVLDKIKNMLGDFEYFYNLDGQFVFQRKKTYVNAIPNNLVNSEDDVYADSAAVTTPIEYHFEDGVLITSYQNTPNLSNVKNDYVVWGNRKGVKYEIPVHFRYAIDRKPTYYCSYDNKRYISEEHKDANKEGFNTVDWREIIYQMAVDHLQHNQDRDFLFDLQALGENKIYYPQGITGYEQYYTDLLKYWRQLYNPQEIPATVSYTYDFNAIRELKPEDADRQLIELFIQKDYIGAATLESPKREDIVTIVNGELHPLLDTIPVVFEFDASGKQNKYYVTSKEEEGYSLITKDVADQIPKNQIYIKKADNEYINILESAEITENCFIEKDLSNKNEYISINDLPVAIKELYFNEESQTYNKFLTVSPMKMDGTVDTSEKPYTHFIEYYMEKFNYYQQKDKQGAKYLYWNKIIRDNPDQINFWFDFLDGESFVPVVLKESTFRENIDKYYARDKDGDEIVKATVWNPDKYIYYRKSRNDDLNNFAIPVIGDRPKVVNDKDVKSIYFREVPTLIFVDDYTEDRTTEFPGYTRAQIDSLNYFSISAQGKSAKEVTEELLYQYGYCAESINITSVPIYYLQPNVRILVKDENSKIDGEYLVSRITIPLQYNGTMQISATKAPTRLY